MLSLPTIDSLCSRQERFVWEQACIRASRSEDSRSVTPPQSNTLQTNRTHKNSHKLFHLLNKLQSIVAWRHLNLMYWCMTCQLYLTCPPPPSQWRWCYVSVWIPQWIYYHSLSGPVCQACDPGSGQPSCWATWSSVSSPATCFKMLEWYLTANRDAAGNVNVTVKMKLLWQQRGGIVQWAEDTLTPLWKVGLLTFTNQHLFVSFWT